MDCAHDRDEGEPRWIAPRQEPDPGIEVFYTSSELGKELRGQVLAQRFELGEAMGVGATARVYDALDRVTGARVAVKVLNGDVEERLRGLFHREARLAARHSSKRVALAYHFGEDQGVAFTVFRLERGTPLEALADGKPMPWRRLCAIVLQVLEGLEDLHAERIVHRDVHPGNVLVRETASGADDVTLIDLGFAVVMPPKRITGSPVPEPRIAFGREGYIAPEAFAGMPPVPGWDVYAVGVLLYECLTAQPIPEYQRAPGVLAVPPLRVIAPGAGIPRRLDAAVLRAVSDVEVRFPSAAAMAHELRLVLAEGEERQAEPEGETAARGVIPVGDEGVALPSVIVAAQRRPRGRRWLWSLPCILAVGLLVLLLRRPEDGRPVERTAPETAPQIPAEPLQDEPRYPAESVAVENFEPAGAPPWAHVEQVPAAVRPAVRDEPRPARPRLTQGSVERVLARESERLGACPGVPEVLTMTLEVRDGRGVLRRVRGGPIDPSIALHRCVRDVVTSLSFRTGGPGTFSVSLEL